MNRIVYIHGANSSPICFNYIKKNLPSHEFLDIAYSVDVPFIENEYNFKETIKAEFGNKHFSLVGHSMGGLFAARMLNDMGNARRALTISSPYGGSRFVEYLRWICPSYQLFKDIKISSDVVQSFRTWSTSKEFFNIVTHGGGNPLIGELNDGTVTLRSQESLKCDFVKRYDLNHFEVLMSDDLVSDINSLILGN